MSIITWFLPVNIAAMREDVVTTFGGPAFAATILWLIILKNQNFCQGAGSMRSSERVEFVTRLEV